jgi:hypothetical protein
MGDFEFNKPKNTPVSSEELISDLKKMSGNSESKISMQFYVDNGGKYNPSTIIRRFGSWSKALEKIGLEAGNKANYSDEELFLNILNIWQAKGKQPVRADLAFEPSTISQSPYNRRFKSWSDALESFVAYANQSGKTNESGAMEEIDSSRTGRDPSLRLRFNVLKRDNFTCVQCGASPAKNPDVELHIDHITPWSKGGETVEENLQTLCSKCNLGKSNLE